MAIPKGWKTVKIGGKTDEMFSGSAVCETVFGDGINFVEYEMTILSIEDIGFIPVHGAIRKEPVKTIKQAAKMLTDYYNGLPDSHKMTATAYDKKYGRKIWK